MKGRFCFKISAELGMAYDNNTGEPAPLYSELDKKGSDGNPVEITDPDEYNRLHEKAHDMLASHLECDRSYIEKVTIEGYDKIGTEQEQKVAQ
jgi:hypothetical protein